MYLILKVKLACSKDCNSHSILLIFSCRRVPVLAPSRHHFIIEGFMRIKNLTSNASNQGIICILALFLAFAAIDIAILVIVLNSGMTLGESFSWMFHLSVTLI